MGTDVLRRPARRPAPELSREAITLASPPALGDPPSAAMGAPMLMMPLMSGSGAMIMVLSNLQRPLYATAGLLMLVASVAMGIVLFTAMRSGPRRKLRQERERYLDYLEDARHTIREAVKAQRDHAAARHPHPGLLLGLACDAGRRWERRGTDPDLLTVRCGLASVPLSRSLSLRIDEQNPLTVYDPVCHSGAEELVDQYAHLADQPLTLPLGEIGETAIVGEYARTRAAAQAMLAQLAVLVAPEDLRVAIVAHPTVAPEWTKFSWLPHLLADPGTADAPVPLMCATTAELAELLADDLAVRAAELRRRRGALPGPGSRRLLVVVDGEHQVSLPGLIPELGAPQLLGVHVWTLVAEQRQEPEHTTARLKVGADAVTVTRIVRTDGSVGETVQEGRPDTLDPADLAAIARALSPWRLALDDVSHALSGVHGLTDILGVADPADVDWRRTWAPREESALLRVPFAVDADGRPVELDLKESALGGMGPHGLIVGATGSGKSETLRTLVAALAVRHPPERLALLTVDFKGGATFADCDSLPHSAGAITNLADDLGLVDRFAEALYGEMSRRQQLLKDAGNLPNVHAYAKLRHQNPDLEPLPHLLVIIDEFSELLTAKPDFSDLFVAVGRIGRSIGVHLLLATQRLESTHLRGLESHLSYRIGLRTFSEAESREAIGVPDAYKLPPEPGSGYLKVDTTIFTRFKAAMVSGRYTPPREVEQQVLPVLPWPVPPVVNLLESLVDSLSSRTLAEQPDTERSVLRVLVASLARAAETDGIEPVRPVWLAPLPEALPLSAVDSDAAAPTTAGRSGAVTAVLGLADHPREQRQGPLEWDLSGADANLVVLGAPSSGKSTLIRTLVASLSLRYPPTSLAAYVIDYGGGGLGTLADLPHVAVAAGRSEPELVNRTLAEVRALLDHRENLMRRKGIDSAAGLRRAAADGAVDVPGDVVLAIDGWGGLHEANEDANDVLMEIASRGPALGVHTVLTAVNSNQVRARLAASFSGRIELRLAEAFDSGIDRKLIEELPKEVPGRVLTADKRFAHIALPRIDGETGTDDLAEGFAELARTVRRRWPGPGVAAVKALPVDIGLDELVPALAAPASGDPYTLAPVIGVAESDLGAAVIDFRTDPHLIVFGDTQTGKTTLLRGIMRQVIRRPNTEAALFLVDYRRSHLEEIPEEHLITYCNTAAHTAQNAFELAEALKKRLPGPEVTAKQLRDRDWWTGPEVFVVVDDYDLVTTSAGNPLAPLTELAAHGADLGFHLVIARRTGGASRAIYEPLLRQVCDMSSPGLLFSGDRLEGRLVNGTASRQLPPGRALLTRRGQSPDLVQVARP